MLRSRPCRGAIGFVAAMLVVSEGCFVYRPTTLPVPAGAAVRVEGTPLDIYQGTEVGPAPAECHATRLYGELRYERGDTLVVGPVLGLSHRSPKGACRRVTTATVVVSPAATRLSVRRFSGWRTTGLVVGVVATAALVAGIVYVESYAHYDSNMQPR